MEFGDHVQFRSKHASFDYRVLRRGLKWSNQHGTAFAATLKKEPLQQFRVWKVLNGFNSIDVPVRMVELEGFWGIWIEESLLKMCDAQSGVPVERPESPRELLQYFRDQSN